MKPRINLYPDDKLMKWIRESSKSQRRSMNSFLLMLIDYFKAHPEISGLETN